MSNWTGGRNWFGPGNDIENTDPPTDYNDTLAREHDFAYAEAQEQGINPYIYFLQADATLADNLELKYWEDALAYIFFKTKRYLAPHATVAYKRQKTGLQQESRIDLKDDDPAVDIDLTSNNRVVHFKASRPTNSTRDIVLVPKRKRTYKKTKKRNK